MAIRVALNHKTQYTYDRPVTLQPHVIRLRPAPHCRTPILSYSLRVEPEPHFLNWQQDPYGNYLARVVFLKPAQALSVQVDLVVEMAPINPFDYFIEPYAERYPFVYESGLARELVPYLETAPAGPRLLELVESLRRHDVASNDFLVAINQRLQKEVRYIVRLEPGVQTCEETLTLGRGSCRDSAWLMVQTLRHLGLAARFASGYLIQLAADVKALDGPSGPEHDFTDLHAWAEVFLPGAGWIGLDPTSGLLTGEGHIPLACAAEPTSAAPVTGAFAWTKDPASGEEDQCKEGFHFEMSVTRIHEVPRVTKPYTEEQWRAIDALGNRVEEELQALDVRLTMGGEPTFVSIEGRDAPEWNTEALGPMKQERGGVLLKRLRDRFAPGALLFYGQGKWYPGESLPRWAYGCYWRPDGEPLWQDPALIADPHRDYGHGSDEAGRFSAELARRLGIDAARCIAGHEDVWYYMWRERRLPVNVDPLKSKLDDAEERRRLSKVFEQGFDKVVGYALPLRPNSDGDQPHWESCTWLLREGALFLIPGDSPMGYRLPLDSLPWEAKEERDAVYALDPFAPRGPLPTQMRQNRSDGANPAAQPAGAHARNGRAGGPVIRTTLCVEPRGGPLHIFMPPVERLEDYLDLVAAVEATAAELQTPVLIEGYRPPSDHRLSHFQITPDPGVLEVNIHPAHSWRELVANTTAIYEEAHQARLSTEKFMQDGRHCGTGGGNHVVLGGPTPADSPVLRRPDLLRSLLGCWHNHPSLTYLFSSMFVGPTSQAPRVDEARNDSLYELEIAFQQIPDAGGCSSWVVDRAFRHLLVDVTGNTHRTEFCIDKLFSPDASGDRRGLVELRSFEMPPHARMSLVQQLLIRVLVARFWKSPYRHRLARWGTELHDRFMLPHFVEQDFEDLLTELGQEGYPLDKSWFAAHQEFRFPFLGAVTNRGVELELRQAIEPWHVLGEEVTAGGTARYVDSSVERVQVKVRGMTDSRHVVTCNGRRVPLHPTGTNGEFVAGVRYRAWQPPSCLHPMIPVQAPLVFDLLDTWTGRSVGGCQYHVAHPGGRAYEDFPVNANAAESRRLSRFFPFGHTPGGMTVPPPESQGECPFTLDLRQAPPATPKGGSTTAVVHVMTAIRRTHPVGEVVSLPEGRHDMISPGPGENIPRSAEEVLAMTASNELLSATCDGHAPAADWIGYPPLAAVPDEAFDGRGEARPHWQAFLESLGDLGLPELTRRWEEAKHLIRENGVTYNVYGDPRGMERPWQLDPIPLVVAPAEAKTLEEGLIQRGRLLEAILRDLYGPQKALQSGFLPPELLYPNPAFLRSCHGLQLPGNRYLHLYAANIGRSADGSFWVLGDRTQAPSGAGYALENRIVLSRMLPDTFRNCQVYRLALFFRTLRETLRSIAPCNRDNPRIVLLTPGPFNETYFEHAYLARYLGYTLVEGGDLTVRDDRVFLKVLGGLQPVDVILRRLDDDFCDPLELRPDSSLGVPGLVQAVRAGNVAVANSLGSGLMETAGFLAFLPSLCRHLLGEELRLPSVPTWWCGEPKICDYVISRLPDLVIKPALAGVRMEPVFGGELSKAQLEKLTGEIRARPHRYVGQERLTLSTAPVLADDRLQPRHLVLRAYAAAHEDSYTVMPGGLTRVSASTGTVVVSMQRGGGSKDTWVLSAEPVNNFSLLRPPSLPLELTRGGSDLPSRVADNLYWLGRYAERAEGLTRLLRVILQRLIETSGLGEVPELAVLLFAVSRLSERQAGPARTPTESPLPEAEAELLALMHDARRRGSLASVLNALSRVAGTVRDRISTDMWRVLGDLAEFREIREAFAEVDAEPDGDTPEPARRRRTLSAELELLDRTILSLAAFGGLAMESVTRGEGWRFLDMGRKLERSLYTVGLVRNTLVQAHGYEAPLLETMLQIADSSMTYRRRYQGSLQTAAVLDLLLADETNPRSLAFQMAALSDDVEHLPRDTVRIGRTPEQRRMLESLTALRLADIHQLVKPDADGRRSALEELLARLAAALPAISDAITQNYLSHLQTSRHLSAGGATVPE